MSRARKDSIGDSDYELSSDADSSSDDSEDEVPFEHVNAVQLHPNQNHHVLYNLPAPEVDTFGVRVRHNRSSNFPEPPQEEHPNALHPSWLDRVIQDLAAAQAEPRPRMGWDNSEASTDVSEHEELFGPPDFGSDDEDLEEYFNNMIPRN